METNCKNCGAPLTGSKCEYCSLNSTKISKLPNLKEDNKPKKSFKTILAIIFIGLASPYFTHKMIKAMQNKEGELRIKLD